jgi:hypothetical protein
MFMRSQQNGFGAQPELLIFAVFALAGVATEF